MRTARTRITLSLVAVGLSLAGCAEVKETSAVKKESPSHLETIEGSTIKRVILVPKAVERLGIQTVTIRPATPQEMEVVTPAGQGGRTAIPYDAVIYDKTGAPFTFTNPAELAYVRQAITVEGIKNKVAVLSAGPTVGTKVVTVGAIELYGAETGVGK